MQEFIMSGHGNKAPEVPDKRLVVTPNGSSAHPVPLFMNHFTFRKTESTPQSVRPEHVFEHNTPGMEAENFEPTSHLYGVLDANTTEAFRSNSQQAYALLERSPGSSSNEETMQEAHNVLADYWRQIEEDGVEITKDNVVEHISDAVRNVKTRLEDVGDGSDALSLSITMVKLFRHGDGWGAAVVHTGDTTHGFITNHNKSPLKGHGHVPGQRTGRVTDLTQAEFDPHAKQKGWRNKPARKHSSLNSDPDQELNLTNAYVLPRILRSSEIIICNDQVTGMTNEALNWTDSSQSARAQTVAQREAALLDANNMDKRADELFGTKDHPNAVALFINLEEVPSTPQSSGSPDDEPDDIPGKTDTEPLTPPTNRIVQASRRGARVIREFLTSDDEAMVRRQRVFAGTIGGAALVGAAVIAYKRLPAEQKEAARKRLTDGDAARKIGELLVSVRGSMKNASETLVDKLKTTTDTLIGTIEGATLDEDAVPSATMETLATKKERLGRITKAQAKQVTKKSKRAKVELQKRAAKLRRR